MVNLVYWLKNLLFFDILLLYYYINIRSSIILSPFSGGIYLSLGISVSCLIFSASFVTVFEQIHWSFVILSSILLPIKSQVASVYFWSALFEAVLSVFEADCLAWSRSLWLSLPLQFLLIFLPRFWTHILSKR